MTTGLFVHGGSNDQWTGLALGNLDMNGFSITNINTIQVLQTETTGQALEVYRNLAAASTDSPIVCFANQNVGDDQSVLTVTTAAGAAASNPMVCFENTDAAFDQAILNIVNDGTGYGLLVVGNANAASVVSLVHLETTDAAFDQNILTATQDGTGGGIAINITAVAGGIALDIDQDADSYGIQVLSAATTNTQYGIRVVTGAGATVANFEYAGTEFARLGIHNAADGSNWFYRNLAAANTAGPIVKIEQAHADDDQGALYVVGDNDASGLNPLVLFESTVATFAQPTTSIITVATTSTAYGLKIHSSAGAYGLFMFQSNGKALHIDHNDTGTTPTVHIDRDGNNANDIWGIEIDCDNAGAGDNGGIDMTSFTSCEPLLGVPVDTCTPTANYGAFTVYVNGVGNKLVKLFDAIE